MINCIKLAALPEIDSLASITRRHFEVNLSLGKASGLCAQLGTTEVHDSSLSQILRLEGDEHHCRQKYRECFSLLTAKAGVTQSFDCQAGFSMTFAPIVVEGHCVGAVIASGFRLEDGEDRQANAPLNSLSASANNGQLLKRDAWRLLSDLLVEMALRAAAFLGERRETSEKTHKGKGGAKDYSQIIGRSDAMKTLLATLDKVCDSESSVLVEGPPGVGKELVARAIHYNGPRAKGPFVIQNCSALNDALLDSELFGHKRGAFTGAFSDKAGLFEVAHRGSFFLDEIGDMSPQLQVKILRVLQEGSFVPVGGTETRRVDVRIIAATNRNLEQMVAEGSFREDLYYRINVIKIKVSPLAERRDDIPPLIDHFLERKSIANNAKDLRLSKDVYEALYAYDWPGNVRELENEIERLVVLAGDNSRIELQDLSMRIRQDQGIETETTNLFDKAKSEIPRDRSDDAESFSPTKIVAKLGEDMNLKDCMEKFEGEIIAEVLSENEGNRSKTAEILGVSRRNLLRKLERFGLN